MLTLYTLCLRCIGNGLDLDDSTGVVMTQVPAVRSEMFFRVVSAICLQFYLFHKHSSPSLRCIRWVHCHLFSHKLPSVCHPSNMIDE